MARCLAYRGYMNLNSTKLPKTFTNLLVWCLLFVGVTLYGLQSLLNERIGYNVYKVLDLDLSKLAVLSLLVGVQLVLFGIVEVSFRNFVRRTTGAKNLSFIGVAVAVISEALSFAFIPDLPIFSASLLALALFSVLYANQLSPKIKVNRNLLMLLFLGLANTMIVFSTHEYRNQDQHIEYAKQLAERKDTLAEQALARIIEQYSFNEIPSDDKVYWENMLLSDAYLGSNYQFRIENSPLNVDPLSTLVPHFYISSDQHPTYRLHTPDSHTLTLKLNKDFRQSVYLPERPYKQLDDLDKYSFTVVEAGQIILSNTHNFDSEILNIPLPAIGAAEQIEHKGFDVTVFRKDAESFVLIGEPLSEIQVVVSNFAFFFSLALVLLILFEAGKALQKNINNPQYWATLPLDAKINSILVGFTLTLFIVISITTFVFLVSNNHETTNQRQISAAKTLKQGLEWTTQFGQLPIHSIKQAFLRDKAAINGADVDLYSPTGFLVNSSIASVKISPAPAQIEERILTTLEANPAAMLVERYSTPSGRVILTYFGLSKGRKLTGVVSTATYEKDVETTFDIPIIMSHLLNVYVGLLLLSWIIGLVLVDMLNRPLNLLANRLSSFELGKKTEPLVWLGDGVIGSLIDAHNQMVEKVEATSRELIATEREGAWQVMALQIAHEINNTLTPLRLNTQYINASLDREQIESLDGARRMGERMVERIDYLSKVATQFQLFANLEKPEGNAVDLQLLVRSFLSKNSFELPITSRSEVNHLHSTETQMETSHFEHVLDNLLTYAHTKALDVDGREIELTIGNCEESVCIHITFQSGYLDGEEKKNLFDPTFNSLGSESGLALPICHRIIDFYEGSLEYKQAGNQLATFHLSLPTVKKDSLVEESMVIDTL